MVREVKVDRESSWSGSQGGQRSHGGQGVEVVTGQGAKVVRKSDGQGVKVVRESRWSGNQVGKKEVG